MSAETHPQWKPGRHNGANWLSVTSEPEFLGVLSRLGIALEFTYYSRPGDRSAKNEVV